MISLDHMKSSEVRKAGDRSKCKCSNKLLQANKQRSEKLSPEFESTLSIIMLKYNNTTIRCFERGVTAVDKKSTIIPFRKIFH